MAIVVDQVPSFKYFCRICKKGFGCGRALGGHMRAHGIGDDSGNIDDDDPASDWEVDKLTGSGGGGGGTQPSGIKRMYALRTNPNRLKSCRVCENCGKEFLSWKSFLEHGKCSSPDAEDPPASSPEFEEEDGGATRRDYAWSKGKRSRRAKFGSSLLNCPSSEEENLAHCLVMLSTARANPLVVETEESCASASKEEERRNPVNVTMLPSINRLSTNTTDKVKGATKGVFECKACKKVFNSHQALGGHRASHKKVKGCFAANLDDMDEGNIEEDVITNDELTIFTKSTSMLHFDHSNNASVPNKRKSKLHECSICHRTFTSGQALGGHKRCHWLTSNAPDHSNTIARFHQFQDPIKHDHQRTKMIKSEQLDLNLPALDDDNHVKVRRDHENTLTFQVPTEIFLQPWIGIRTNDDHNNNNNASIHNNVALIGAEDEAGSKVKLAKLSDLKDMTIGSGSSPWLQVGIGSTSNMGTDP